MAKKPGSIDAYLASVPDLERAALEKLRATLRELLPEADECISYGIPAFREGGVVVAGFCARKNGCSYFPFSGSTLAASKKDLAAYAQTKSSLHFSADRPLPKNLVKKLVQVRRAEVKKRGR